MSYPTRGQDGPVRIGMSIECFARNSELRAALHPATHDLLFDIVIKRCGAGVSPPAGLPSLKRSRSGCAQAGHAAIAHLGRLCFGVPPCVAAARPLPAIPPAGGRPATEARYTVTLLQLNFTDPALATEGVTILPVSPEGCTPQSITAPRRRFSGQILRCN